MGANALVVILAVLTALLIIIVVILCSNNGAYKIVAILPPENELDRALTFAWKTGLHDGAKGAKYTMDVYIIDYTVKSAIGAAKCALEKGSCPKYKTTLLPEPRQINSAQ